MRFPVGAWLPLLAVVAVASFSCTGLGLATAALAMRVRETAVLSNLLFGILLIFCGVNVPLSAMPAWMGAVAAWLPMTHGIAAARGIAGGAAWSDVAGLVGRELAVGLLYVRARAGAAGRLRAREPPAGDARPRLRDEPCGAAATRPCPSRTGRRPSP